MKHWMLCVLPFTGLSLTACIKPDGDVLGSPHKPSPNGPRVTMARVIGVQPLVHGRTYESDDVLLLPQVRGPRSEWTILIGPNPGCGPVKLSYSNEEPDVFVENGWAFISIGAAGTSTAPAPRSPSPWGKARTVRVAGSAEGTEFVVQEQDGVHRVFLLSGSGDKVYVTLDGKEAGAKYLTASNTYVEIGPSDTALPDPQPIPDASTSVGRLIQTIESVAAASVSTGP